LDFSFIPRKKDRFRFELKLPAFKKLERKKVKGCVGGVRVVFYDYSS